MADDFDESEDEESVDFLADNGEWRPTKKGITVKPERVDELIGFLAEGKKKIDNKED